MLEFVYRDGVGIQFGTWKESFPDCWIGAPEYAEGKRSGRSFRLFVW
jgi:hypothetical protein